MGSGISQNKAVVTQTATGIATVTITGSNYLNLSQTKPC